MVTKKTIGLGHEKDDLYVLDSSLPVAPFVIKKDSSVSRSDELLTCTAAWVIYLNLC